MANLSIRIDIIGKKSCIVCVDNNISCRYVLSIKFLAKINRISVNFSSNCCSIILVLSPHQKVDSNNMQKCIIACFPSIGIWTYLSKESRNVVYLLSATRDLGANLFEFRFKSPNASYTTSETCTLCPQI